MGIFEDKKLRRKTQQTNPTNPTGNTDIDTNKFDIEKDTIKKQQNKE
ncbi:hypothetical protein [Cellulophaga sp. Hel_I_12]|jgi:hypothetical protein|nr:hypothetical protein [Cellulophaga sp. Hel_I_12]